MQHPLTHRIRFTLRQLQYFCAVARTGQISTAALECHITQSSMTAAISELERALGVTLLERAHRGVRLSKEGIRFLERAQAVLDSAAAATALPAEPHDELRGVVKVGVGEALLGGALPPLVSMFEARHPGASVIPLVVHDDNIESAIESGEVDLATVRLHRFEHDAKFSKKTLIRAQRRVWVGATHPLAKHSRLSLKDLGPFRYVDVECEEGNRDTRLILEQAGISPANLLRTASLPAARALVAAGLGVTVLSTSTFWMWSAADRKVRAVPLLDQLDPVDVGLLWAAARPLTPLAIAFRDHVNAWFSLGENASAAETNRQP